MLFILEPLYKELRRDNFTDPNAARSQLGVEIGSRADVVDHVSTRMICGAP